MVDRIEEPAAYANREIPPASHGTPSPHHGTLWRSYEVASHCLGIPSRNGETLFASLEALSPFREILSGSRGESFEEERGAAVAAARFKRQKSASSRALSRSFSFSNWRGNRDGLKHSRRPEGNPRG